jgi:hypothetical protein
MCITVGRLPCFQKAQRHAGPAATNRRGIFTLDKPGAIGFTGFRRVSE